MKRLGYSRFVAQGGDLGAGICTWMARLAPPELLGIHSNFPGTIPPEIAKYSAVRESRPNGPVSRGEARIRATGRSICQEARLCLDDDDTSSNLICASGLSNRARGLAF